MDQAKFVVLAVLFAMGALGSSNSRANIEEQKSRQAQVLPEGTFRVCGRNVSLEIARSEQERNLGLGHRDSLPKNKGMLFVFEQSAPLIFWMKGVTFDIDIGFFDHTGLLKSALTMKGESPLKREAALPRYPSPGPVRYAVELPKGFFASSDQSKCTLTPLPKH